MWRSIKKFTNLFKKHKFKKYGWIKDLPDHRDFQRQYKAIQHPLSVDLRTTNLLPDVWNQLNLGACGLHAGGAAYSYLLKKEDKPVIMPSRLFMYYNVRVLENTVNEDSGVQLRDVMKSLNSDGVCIETLWPYNIKQFTLKPSTPCYNDAKQRTVLKYERVPNTQSDIENVLAEGYPVIFGALIFEGFESEDAAKTGIISMPSVNERPLGGHALLIVGYDRTKHMFIVRNSWGPEWGDKGYCYFPYDYILNPNLAGDFWALTFI